MFALRLTLLPLVLVALSLAGCGKAPSTPASTSAAADTATTDTAADAGTAAVPAAPVPDPTLAALDLGEFKIISITLGSQLDADKNVLTAKTQFTPKDAIHVSVVSAGKHQGLKMAAKWTTADGTVIANTEQVLVPDSAMASTFSLNNAQPWPVGRYQVSIFLEGREQQSIAFEVR